MSDDEPLVQIGNQSFAIGFDADDDARRKTYFRNGSGKGLTEQEANLLISLGFDSILEKALAPQMAEFFMDLKQCSNDTNIHLKKECELPYYVVWSALFHNQKETRRRLNDNIKSKEAVSDLDDAMTRALVKGLKPKEQDPIVQLFSLIILPEPQVKPDKIIENLFILILLPSRKKVGI